MRRSLAPLAALAACGVTTFLVFGTPPPARRVTMVRPGAKAAPVAEVASGYGKIPLTFVENRGQSAAAIAYEVLGRDAISFRAGGVTFQVPGEGSRGERRSVPGPRRNGVRHGGLSADRLRREPPALDEVTLDFIAANPESRPEGQDVAPGVVSYFRGAPEEWKTAIPTYRRVVYRELWPGIDLEFAGERRLKYTATVRPGAKPEIIRIAVRGARALELSDGGDLVIRTATTVIRDERPVAYQEIDGQRVTVTAEYVIDSDAHAFGFRLGAYDPSLPLVIDPALFVYAGYFGRGGEDRGLGIAVDGAGNAYFCGEVFSSVSAWDAYVVKVNPAGDTILYTAFVGGLDYDAAYDMAVDSTGSAYIVGATESTPARGYPVRTGPDLTFNGTAGDIDLLIAKLGTNGTTIIYAGYLGGTGWDFGEGVWVDATGAAYVDGPTESPNFPTVVGPDLTHNGLYDTFVVKVKPTPGSATVTNNLDFSGFIGGSGNDTGVSPFYVTGGHITVDASGHIYVVGQTNSTEASLPVRVGPDLTYNGGIFDAFIAKLLPDGSDFVFLGYVGGDQEDMGFGIGVDASGAVYFGGHTYSTEATFPVKVGPDLTFNGMLDAFVVKVLPDGSDLEYCGFIGGDKDDQGLALRVTPSGHAYVIGQTGADETTFPVTVGPDLTYNGTGPDDFGDTFVGRLKVVPSDPVPANNYDFMGYVGGSQGDGAFWGALDASGDIYLAGDTASDETTFPDGDGFGTLPGPDLTANGGYDAFVTKIDWQAAVCVYRATMGSVSIAGVFMTPPRADGISLTAPNDVPYRCPPPPADPEMILPASPFPLVVYQIDDNTTTLKLTKDAVGGTVNITW